MMNGKTALVTGASRGIGRAIALRLAREGMNVAIVYAGNTAAAEETAQGVREAGAQANCYACDVADEAAVGALCKRVAAEMGPIYALVNNAGITRDKLAAQMKEEDFEKVIDTNLNSAFYMIKNTYHQFMKRRSGRIINISSISGLMGNAGQANYAAAKAGMVGLTKSVAKELAGRGITCNAVAPGFIETDMTAVLSEKVKAAAEAQIPMKKMGKPEDVAAAVAFLASDAARYITGQVLSVDGGLNM